MSDIGSTYRSAAVPHAAEGETVRLGGERAEEHRCRSMFGKRSAWLWCLPWLIWPALWAVKGIVALTASVGDVLFQPRISGISVLPFVLIGAGVLLLVLDQRRERR